MAQATRPKTSTRRGGWTTEQNRFVYGVVYLLISLLFRFWVRRFRALGMEQIPAGGGAFVIANHTSGMDPFILGLSIKHRMLRGPGKIELFKHPLIAYFMRKLGIFPLRQGGADPAGVRTMVELVRHGRLVAVYPEGGRSSTGEMKAFVPDFARLAIKLQATLIPVGIAGANDLLPIGSLLPRRNTAVAVVYGAPFDLSEFYGQKLSPDLLSRATEILQDRVAELVAQAQKERAAMER